MVVPEATTENHRRGHRVATDRHRPPSACRWRSSAALVSASVSAALSPAPTLITGASLVPVMVIVTVWSSKAVLSSVARTV